MINSNISMLIPHGLHRHKKRILIVELRLLCEKYQIDCKIIEGKFQNQVLVHLLIGKTENIEELDIFYYNQFRVPELFNRLIESNKREIFDLTIQTIKISLGVLLIFLFVQFKSNVFLNISTISLFATSLFLDRILKAHLLKKNSSEIEENLSNILKSLVENKSKTIILADSGMGLGLGLKHIELLLKGSPVKITEIC